MAAIYAGWMRAQQASRHFVAFVIFEILRTFRDAALRASFGCLVLALVLRAVPDQHGIGLALGRNFLLWRTAPSYSLRWYAHLAQVGNWHVRHRVLVALFTFSLLHSTHVLSEHFAQYQSFSVFLVYAHRALAW